MRTFTCVTLVSRPGDGPAYSIGTSIPPGKKMRQSVTGRGSMLRATSPSRTAGLMFPVPVRNSDTTDPDYVLARNVDDAKFQVGIGKDANNTTCVTNVSLSIRVKIGNNEVRLSGSAAPRRNLVY